MGDHGAGIAVDLLSVDSGDDVPMRDRNVIVRVPFEDGIAFCAAVAAGGGLRVEKRAAWLDGVTAAMPRDLFDFNAG